MPTVPTIAPTIASNARPTTRLFVTRLNLTAAAQSGTDQHAGRLRNLAADASRRRGADRFDAGSGPAAQDAALFAMRGSGRSGACGGKW
jgi:hypothetical protein